MIARKVSARKLYLEYPTYQSRLYLEYLTQHVCKTAQVTGRFCDVSEAEPYQPEKTQRTGRSRIPRGKARRCGVTEESGCRWGIKTLLKVSRELSSDPPQGG